MFKKITSVIALASSITGVSSVQAADTCLTIGNPTVPYTAGLLQVTDCTLPGGVWATLKASGKFPDIFLPTPKLTGLCYVSTSDIPGMLGKKSVSASTTSAWTTEFTPALFSHDATTGNLGSVITQWTIRDSSNNVLGNVYTHDSVDLGFNPTGISSEQNVIIGGSGNYKGAVGAIRVGSLLKTPTVVEIESVSGTLCLPASN